MKTIVQNIRNHPLSSILGIAVITAALWSATTGKNTWSDAGTAIGAGILLLGCRDPFDRTSKHLH